MGRDEQVPQPDLDGVGATPDEECPVCGARVRTDGLSAVYTALAAPQVTQYGTCAASDCGAHLRRASGWEWELARSA
jgi:hypothetical protein